LPQPDRNLGPDEIFRRLIGQRQGVQGVQGNIPQLPAVDDNFWQASPVRGRFVLRLKITPAFVVWAATTVVPALIAVAALPAQGDGRRLTRLPAERAGHLPTIRPSATLGLAGQYLDVVPLQEGVHPLHLRPGLGRGWPGRLGLRRAWGRPCRAGA